MSIYQRNGVLAGAFVGIVVAFTHWDGRVIVAASSILFATAIGWGVGVYLENRRAK